MPPFRIDITSTTNLVLLLVINCLFMSNATAVLLNNNLLSVSCNQPFDNADEAYETNVDTLLSIISSKSLSINSGKAIAGIDPHRTYGIYLCQGDLFNVDCQSCIVAAAAHVTGKHNCSSSYEAIIWYDHCMLRYSNTNFYGIPDTTGFNISNPVQPITSPSYSVNMMSSLIQIASKTLPLMFASEGSANNNFYGFAQCTSDLTSAGCSTCLDTILDLIKVCCGRNDGWRYMAGSCWIRYESAPFLQQQLNGISTESPQSTCSSDNLTSTNNLNYLLTYIVPHAGSTGFYNETVSQFSILALCRGDIVPSDNCLSCLNKASTSITEEYCPNKTRGTVWYDECLVRYSNVTFFGTVDYVAKSTCGSKTVPSRVWEDTTTFAMQLVRIAANRALMFAADEKEVGDPLHKRQSYVLVQCTRDLNREGCENCLATGVSVVTASCYQTNAWTYLSGSCIIRYEEYLFFKRSAEVLPPQVQPTEPAPLPKSPEKEGNITSRA